MESITSRSNPLCTHFRKLASSQGYREETGEFLCDSPKLLREAVQWCAPIRTVMYTKGAELPLLSDNSIRVVQVSESVMKAVSPMETPQGVVFSCRSQEEDASRCLREPRWLVLDGVQDPGNVGTILRTADAFGWAVILLPGCAGLYNPKTLRAGMGVHFRRAIYQATLEKFMALLDEANLPLYGAALREDTVDVRQVDLSCCAVAVGSEGRGLSPEVLTACDQTVRIPMFETCESLNAAVAAAVLLWEGARND